MSCVEAAARYADGVIAGDIVACEYVKAACRRFVNDLGQENWDYYLDVEEAERWCRFLELLPHTKGKWAARKELLVLAPWQVFCTVNIFGWRHKETRFRRFREAYIEVGRKNGKSLWTAGVCLGMLAIDKEHGAEVYCGATTEKQAWEVFKPARLQAVRTPDLCAQFGVQVNAKSLSIEATGAKFEPLIGNPGDGASPSLGVADEYHEHANDDQVSTLVTGMAAREQPLMLYITTAGVDMGGPCYAKRDDVLAVLQGAATDETVFGIIYTLDEKDAWDTVEAQQKANPNYGVSVNPGFLAGQLAQARRNPRKQAAYKTKHLNLWLGSKAPWMNLLAFQACRKKALKREDFTQQKCFVALDLASKIDLASMALLFPPCEVSDKWAAFFVHYLPESVISQDKTATSKDARADRYAAWHAGGWITATPGDTIDYSYIEADLEEIAATYDVEEVPYDPFQATQFSQNMVKKGLNMVEFGATVKNFSEPMKDLEKKVLDKQIVFERDPVALWCMGNVRAKLDKKDNIFPDKDTVDKKIDPIVALIMANGRALFYDAEARRSIYEDQDGIDFVNV